jgi:hypothetical protein
MKLSLRNLLRRLVGRSPARGRARAPHPTRLHVEQLGERIVPVINLMPYTFNLPGAGVLHVTNQWANGSFVGTFQDVSSGITANVSGQLTALGGSWDQMTFQGPGQKPFEHEQVAFTGKVYEGPTAPVFMEGTVAESYWIYFPGLPPLHWTTAHQVEAFGHL